MLTGSSTLSEAKTVIKYLLCKLIIYFMSMAQKEWAHCCCSHHDNFLSHTDCAAYISMRFHGWWDNAYKNSTSLAHQPVISAMNSERTTKLHMVQAINLRFNCLFWLSNHHLYSWKSELCADNDPEWKRGEITTDFIQGSTTVNFQWQEITQCDFFVSTKKKTPSLDAVCLLTDKTLNCVAQTIMGTSWEISWTGSSFYYMGPFHTISYTKIDSLHGVFTTSIS